MCGGRQGDGTGKRRERHGGVEGDRPASWTIGTREPEAPREQLESSPHCTGCEPEAQRQARTCPEPSCPLTASSVLWSWAVSFHVPSGSVPTAAWLRPSSAWVCGGSSRLGTGVGLPWSPGSCPSTSPSPQSHLPSLRWEAPGSEPSWGEGRGSRGSWEGAMGLPHLSLLMASVCTWTV